MIDHRLLAAINRGRCFALVGSGPSCEMGYPSWEVLAQKAIDLLSARGTIRDVPSYNSALANRRFPEVFTAAEKDAGGRAELGAMLSPLLRPTPGRPDQVYRYLARWPLACYLTTNFDNELDAHLKREGAHYASIRNRLEDLRQIRDGTSRLIAKLHSDLEHPDEYVLTSGDYHRAYVSDDMKYFRDKMRQIFEMFDLLIIGHSLSDRHIDWLLQTAKQTASPAHPVFLVAPDLSRRQIQDYNEHHNIVALTYDNPDGTHRHLHSLLKQVDRWIRPRGTHVAPSAAVPTPEEVEAATGMYVFRRLYGGTALSGPQALQILGPLVLIALKDSKDPGTLPREIFSTEPLKSTLCTDASREAATEVLKGLSEKTLLATRNDRYWILDDGRNQVDEASAVRREEERQALSDFGRELQRLYPPLDASTKSIAEKTIRDALAAVYKSRGLALAGRVFAGQSLSADDLPEVFRAVSDAASSLEGSDLQAAFVEAGYALLIEPSEAQLKFLGSLSQGYFLHHLLGLDPSCARVREDLFSGTLWLFDSSVLIPLVAQGCHSHEFAADLFRRLGKRRAHMFTTKKLFEETWGHLKFAVEFVGENGLGSKEFFAFAQVPPGRTQNLFVDGFVRLAADGKVGAFRDYVKRVCPGGLRQENLESVVQAMGVTVVDVDLGDLKSEQDAIRKYRRERGTYKGEFQVAAEAEALQVVKSLRRGDLPIDGYQSKQVLQKAFWISLSRVLDEVSQKEGIVTWKPEALYRFVSSLAGDMPSADLLQQCMLQDYYYAGVSFIDRPRYVKFFGPIVDQARLSFAEQREAYVSEVGGLDAGQLERAFDATPDLQKPYFVTQMQGRLESAASKRAEEAERRATEAERRVRRLEAEKKTAWKTKEMRRLESEAGRARNLQDPKHLKKRLRQAKKRARRKGHGGHRG